MRQVELDVPTWISVVLGPARRDPHRDVLAILRDVDVGKSVLPFAPVRGCDGDFVRICDQSFLALQSLAHVQLAEKPLIKVEVAGKTLDAADQCRGGTAEELLDAREQFVAARNVGQRCAGVVVLILEPGLHLGVPRILHVAIVVDDLRTIIIVGDGAHGRDWLFRRRSFL